MGFIVAIDGTSGSGKTTTARRVSELLGWFYLDTGSTYRAVAYYVLEQGVDPSDKNKVIEILDKINVSFEEGENGNRLILNGEDVSDKLRTDEVNKAVTLVSKMREVRKWLVNIQREIVDEKNAIVEGRDIGTVVFPEADLKFYMNADIDVRAERRKKQKGATGDLEAVKKDLMRRDYHDSTRKESPLKKAPDAHLIDTTSLTIDEQVERVVSEIKKLNESTDSI